MKITDNRKPNWFIYPAWIALNSLSIPIAFAISWTLISLVVKVVGSTIQAGGQTHITEDFLLTYIFGPTLGLVIGLLQYLLLRRYLPRIVWWIAATTVGYSLGQIVGYTLTTNLYGAVDVRTVWFKTLMTTLAGGAMGLAQWLVLRKCVRQSTLWILANVFGWVVLGWGMSTLSNQMVIPAVGILLVPGITTSLALWYFLDRLPKQEDNGENISPSNSLETTVN